MTERDEEQIVQERMHLLEQELAPEDDLTLERRRARIVSHLGLFAESTRLRGIRRVKRLAGAALVLVVAAGGALSLNLIRESPRHSPGLGEATELTLTVEGSRAEIVHATGVTDLEGNERTHFVRVERITTPHNGTARVQVPAGAPKAGLRMNVSPETENLLPRPSATWGLEVVHLQRGAVELSVPKLAQGTSFSVVTPSVRVSVIGTAFNVTVNPLAEQDSCVRVTEGVVRVAELTEPHAGIALLGAGQTWGCSSPSVHQTEETIPRDDLTETSPASSSPEISTNRPTHPPDERRVTDGLPPEEEAPVSTLAKEAALLSRAIRAERRQDYAAAERDLRTLLHRYPRSPVASEAHRLLEKVTSEHAKSSARPPSKAR